MKKNIVLFGAGEYGKRVFNNIKKECNVIAFIDNDESKYNQEIDGIAVLSPNELGSLNYDKIYITSMYALEITSQLVNDFNIKKDNIEYIEIPKNKKTSHLYPIMIAALIIGSLAIFLL